MENYTFDLTRIFIGNYPLLFIVEILLRTGVMFAYTLILLRFFSGRGAGVGELSLFEFVLIVLLGSAVGDPMFYADVPVLHGCVVITIIVVLQRGMITLSNRNPSIEKVLEGVPIRLITDGLVDVEGAHKARLSYAEIQMEIRHEGIENLALVRRAFLETDGRVSIFCVDDPQPRLGLAILPDAYEPSDYMKSGSTMTDDSRMACVQCGNCIEVSGGQGVTVCGRCGGTSWVTAREIVRPTR